MTGASLLIFDFIGFVERRIGRWLDGDEILTSNLQSMEAVAHAFFPG
jgi:hypothetical protein